jgi:hypothetical protein
VSARGSRPFDINASDGIFRFQVGVPVTIPAATNNRRSHDSGPDLSLLEIFDTLLTLIARNPERPSTHPSISVSIGADSVSRGTAHGNDLTPPASRRCAHHGENLCSRSWPTGSGLLGTTVRPLESCAHVVETRAMSHDGVFSSRK